MRALLVGLSIGAPALPYIVRVAYFFNRSGFIHALVHGLVLPPEVQAAMLDYIESILQEDENLQTGRNSFVYRFVSEGGEFEELGIELE